MEADFCLAKRLEMNQGTRSTRLFARWAIPPRQGLHAFLRHRQNGDYIAIRFGLLGKKQARQYAQFCDSACRLIYSSLVLTMLLDTDYVYTSESRKLLKVHHSTTRQSFDEVLDSLARTLSCRNPNRLINNFAFEFFLSGNTPNGRNSFFHTQLINLKNS